MCSSASAPKKKKKKKKKRPTGTEAESSRSGQASRVVLSPPQVAHHLGADHVLQPVVAVEDVVQPLADPHAAKRVKKKRSRPATRGPWPEATNGGPALVAADP